MPHFSEEEAMQKWADNATPVNDDGESITDKPRITPPPRNPRPKGAAKLGSETLAAQATEVLCQLNAMAAVGCMVFMMPQTGRAISAYEDAFRVQAEAALKTDPALCQRILKMSSTSGTMGLLMAYLGMGMALAPTAMSERKNLSNYMKDRKNKDA